MKKLKKFDIVLILFILAAVSVVGIKVFGMGTDDVITAVETRPAQVTIRIENVRTYTASHLTVGEAVLSDETNSAIGVIDKIEILPYEEVVETSDGQLIRATVPDKYTVMLTLDAHLSERETGYFAEGITEIKVNSETKIYTKKVITSGRIEGIEF
ncbi:DUF4330 domain-containing protein [Fusibacter tunisiensis]|uniref:DUF4330 domain-containing protein n=1 Tax=Fusibacter tunisiensis TaxID=1008308 RepID=A0ABS2MSU0_9FIRM|nr:DUF4330 domain-containing protein [Fusibacter tunisiensis]MBM7562474.1 hypothetical protein [Fusibacter tunisiensis]